MEWISDHIDFYKRDTDCFQFLPREPLEIETVRLVRNKQVRFNLEVSSIMIGGELTIK